MDECSPLSFGRTARSMRIDAGVPQAELARRIELPAPYLCGVELGTRPAPLEPTVRRLAHELKLPQETVDTLVTLAAHSRLAWKNRGPRAPSSSTHGGVGESIGPLLREAEQMALRSGVVVEIRARSMRITVRPASLPQTEATAKPRPEFPKEMEVSETR
jgi:hypothetical protein